MQWIKNYQLFLFDFDGLLVNTEELHFQAYQQMCAQRGYDLTWDFQTFSAAAHHTSTGLRDKVYADLPDLFVQEPLWKVLYKEKTQAFLSLLEKGQTKLMNGVAELLVALNQAEIKSCVVTNSPSPFINLIRQQNSLLDLIPHWITREDYTNPKPNPECYQFAIQKYAKSGDRVIGFEDSPKGFEALSQTCAVPVLICPPTSSYLESYLKNSTKYYASFAEISDHNYP